jgi:hypothetical protein
MELDAAILEAGNDVVLLLASELSKGFLEFAAAVIVRRLDRGAIDLCRRHAWLISLLGFAVRPWTLHVPAIGAAIGPSKLAVDEEAAPGLARAGAGFIARDQSLGGGFDEGRLGRGKKR